MYHITHPFQPAQDQLGKQSWRSRATKCPEKRRQKSNAAVGRPNRELHFMRWKMWWAMPPMAFRVSVWWMRARLVSWVMRGSKANAGE